MTAEVEWAKATLQTPESYAAAAVDAARETPLDAEAPVRIYAAYEEVKQESGVLDFEDLLLLTAALIEEHRFVADELRSRYRHFVVDEYQDVNPLQQRLLDAWLGDRDSLCVVGDPDQTIYSFTGASARYLREFPRRYEGTDDGPAGAELPLDPAGGRAGQPGGRLREARGAGRARAGRRLRGEPERRPRRPRTSRAASSPCGRPAPRRARSPCCTGSTRSRRSTSRRWPAAGVPVRAARRRAVLRAARGQGSGRPAAGAARAAEEDRPETLATVVAEVLGTTGWRADHPPAGTGAAREKWENLAALVRLAEAAAAERPTEGLGAFVADLAERAAAQHAPTVEGVTLASLHAAKGLEWDAVFLVGLVEGVLPITHAVTPEQIAEERRLFYVGVTRARRHLTPHLGDGSGGRPPAPAALHVSPRSGPAGSRAARARRWAAARRRA